MKDLVEQNTTKSDTDHVEAAELKIAAMLLESPAITDQEIADKLGLSRQTINRKKNSAVVQSIIKKALSIPEREVRRLTVKALQRLEALLDDDDPRIRLSATLALTRLTGSLMTRPVFPSEWESSF